MKVNLSTDGGDTNREINCESIKDAAGSDPAIVKLLSERLQKTINGQLIFAFFLEPEDAIKNTLSVFSRDQRGLYFLFHALPERWNDDASLAEMISQCSP